MIGEAAANNVLQSLWEKRAGNVLLEHDLRHIDQLQDNVECN